MTGASRHVERLAACVAGETWEMSTSMPRRFISRTTSLAERRQAAVLRACRSRSRPSRCCGVGERHVADAERRSTRAARRGEFSMAWPPSMPMSEAILPSGGCARRRRRGGEREGRPGSAAIMRRASSICSSWVRAGVRAGLDGTQTHQNWAADPPSRSRGMSVCRAAALRRSSFARSPGRPARGSPGQVVVAVHERDATQELASVAQGGVLRVGRAQADAHDARARTRARRA